MPTHAHAEIHLHITWHTKNNHASITNDLRPKLFEYLERRARGEKGVAVHAIGGTDNHIHIAVSVPPTLGISRWIGELKGASSHYVNQSLLNRKGGLEWQSGYGVVSFSTRDIPRVVEYIAAQGDIHQHRVEKWKREHYQGALARNRP